MGSALVKESTNGLSIQEKKTGLGDLPESCLAMVLMKLEPKDICSFAKLNKAFYGASSADFVWESNLPLNYHQIIEKIYDNDDEKLPVFSCKKEIYATLSRFNSIDDGTKKVWLDQGSGGICMAISAKGLLITGIDDRRYWNHIPSQESRFSTIAYLQQIWWFEVNGEIEFPFPEGTYSVFFRVQLGRPYKKFGRPLCDLNRIHGWDIKPVHFQLSTSEGQHSASQCFLEGPGQWLHYHVGDFMVTNSYELTRLKVSMMQIDCTHTKSGLCLDSVVIYPSSFKERLERF